MSALTARIVLCNGCFDPLHGGHILHFKAARKFGTRLVVSVTENKFVNKGKSRPVFDELVRMKMVSELRCVDEVILVRSSLEALDLIRPDVFVKGIEYKDKMLQKDIDYCEKHGIEIRFTSGPKVSSTELIEKLRHES